MEVKINLQYIEQTDEICLEAVKQNGLALYHIKKQTDEICLEAVKQNGLALYHIKEQTNEICLEAVKQNGLALEFVKEQTNEICLEAVKQNGNALRFVEFKYRNKEIYLEAIKQNGNAFIFCSYLMDVNILLEVVKLYGIALEHIKKQTNEICLEAVKQNGFALRYVKEQTKLICLEAVKQNGMALKYAKIQDIDICIEAMRKCKYALEYVYIKYAKAIKPWIKSMNIHELDKNLIFINDNDQNALKKLIIEQIYYNKYKVYSWDGSQYFITNDYYWGIKYIKQSYKLCKIIIQSKMLPGHKLNNCLKCINYKNKKICLQLLKTFNDLYKYSNKQYIDFLILT